jgi:hypothetical protein
VGSPVPSGRTIGCGELGPLGGIPIGIPFSSTIGAIALASIAVSP